MNISASRNISLLAIDDEKITTDFVTNFANKLGLMAISINDASRLENELEHISQHDILFIDLLMPKIDGIKLLSLLSQKNCKAQIVLMSGQGQRILEKTMSIGLKYGLNITKTLQKPFFTKDLFDLLNQLILDSDNAADKESHINQVDSPLLPKPTIDEIKLAFIDQQFVPYFHPQINITNNTIVGYEVLARWESPERGLISPSLFIELIENDPNICYGFTLYMLDNALGLLIRSGIDYSETHLSINIPASILQEDSFVDHINEIVEKHIFTKSHLILELTETAIPTNVNMANETINRMALQGYRISIDDFGTGHSSMEKLRDIMIDEIKIDRSFVSMLAQKDTQAIVKNLVSLANSLELNIVAEGVENLYQLEEIRAMGIDLVQGFYFSKPLSHTLLNVFHSQFILEHNESR